MFRIFIEKSQISITLLNERILAIETTGIAFQATLINHLSTNNEIVMGCEFPSLVLSKVTE